MRDRVGVRRHLGNAASLVTTAGALRATAFVIYALTARFLGAFPFGQLSLAVTLFAVLQELALLGMMPLITREVARDRDATGTYLVNATLVAALMSAVAAGLLWGFVHLMRYDPGTQAVILVLAVGLFPAAVSQACEAVMQAWERMHLIAYVNVPIGVAKMGVAFALLQAGHDVRSIAWLLAGSYAVLAVVEWAILVPYVLRTGARVRPGFSARLFRSAAPFLGTSFTARLQGSLVVILLSAFAGETAVGLFNAARQLTVPLRVAYESVVSSAFPAMCRRFAAGAEGLLRVARLLLAALLALTLPGAALLFAFAGPVLHAVYGGEEFVLVAGVMRILLWVPVIAAVTKVLGQTLWASGREVVNLRIVLINTAVTAVVGFALVRSFGIVGGAATAVVVALVSVGQHYVPVNRLLGSVALLRAAWRPLAASAVMAGFLALPPARGSVLMIIPAGVVYLAALAAMLAWSEGGVAGLRKRYLRRG